MKLLNTVLSIAFLWSALPNSAFAHGPSESRVEIELKNPAAQPAGSLALEFQIFDTSISKVVTDVDLNISHEKLLHLVVYDPSLREFQHVHPVFDGRMWKADLNFSVNGNYFIWAQGELKVDGYEFSSSTRLEIVGGNPALPSPPRLRDVRTGDDKGSVATLGRSSLKAGQMAMLDLTFSRRNGSKPQISPYLGAFAHVIAVPADGDSIIHVHPMAGSSPEQGMLHVTFPNKGAYRLWVQFVDASQIRTVPLSVKVK